MCWVAIDRAMRLWMKRSYPAPRGRWLQDRDDIHYQIYGRFWNKKLQSFVQVQDGDWLDAACLLSPLVRFISPTDPRWLSTLHAIENALVDDSLLYRSQTPHDLTGTKATLFIFTSSLIHSL